MKVRIKFYYNCQSRYKTLKPFNNNNSLSLSATWDMHIYTVQLADPHWPNTTTTTKTKSAVGGVPVSFGQQQL